MSRFPDTTLKFEHWVPPEGTRFVIVSYKDDGSFHTLIYGSGNQWRALGSDYDYESEKDARESVQRGADF